MRFVEETPWCERMYRDYLLSRIKADYGFNLVRTCSCPCRESNWGPRPQSSVTNDALDRLAMVPVSWAKLNGGEIAEYILSKVCLYVFIPCYFWF